MNFSWVEILNSNFFGSLSGALISAIIAIYVLRKDIRFRQNLKEKESKDNFIKAFILIEMWTCSFLQTYNDLNYLLNSKEGVKKAQITRELEAVKECKFRLDNINDDYIPQEVYKAYIDLKSHIDLVYYEYNAYITTIEVFYADDTSILVSESDAFKNLLSDSYEKKYETIQQKLRELEVFKSSR